MNYENLYQKSSYFGLKPNELVVKLLEYKQTGIALDIGAGQGRNALFLAKNDFKVTALDTSAIGLSQLEQSVKDQGLAVKTILADAANFEPIELFDVVLVINTLHHLNKEAGLKLLTRLKDKTNSGGLNVIVAFTTDGDFYRSGKNPTNCYFETEELKDIYANWQILSYEEKITQAAETNDQGENLVNKTAFLLARKY